MNRTMIVAGLIAFGTILAAAPAQAAALPTDPCFGGGFGGFGGFGGGFGGFGGGFGGPGYYGGGFGGDSFINGSNVSAGSGFGHGVASNSGLIGVNALNNIGLGLLSSANGY
jgi:hypothetical protein